MVLVLVLVAPDRHLHPSIYIASSYVSVVALIY